MSIDNDILCQVIKGREGVVDFVLEHEDLTPWATIWRQLGTRLGCSAKRFALCGERSGRVIQRQ